MKHKLQKDWKAKLKGLVPFGLGQAKPKHFRDMAGVVWKNRDNLPYAWKVLSKGVCDGCALGVAGFHDWTIDGVHLGERARLDEGKLGVGVNGVHDVLLSVGTT